jgi:uncharacterized protein (TIGR01741 family)
MIPEGWRKIYLYAQINEGAQDVFFYYDPEGKDQPIYCLDIPKLFHVNEDEFDELDYKLHESFDDLWQEFKRNGQEPWTNLTFVLENTGKFKINYSYEDISEIGPFERLVIWTYQNLGIKLSGAFAEELLNDYLKRKES